jgi:hypothetical protein
MAGMVVMVAVVVILKVAKEVVVMRIMLGAHNLDGAAIRPA